MRQGQIRKALSGFYYVYSDGKTYQTRGRGNFRVRDTTPLVGDIVDFESENKEEGILLAVHERKNELVRPPIANVDIGIIIMSAVEPAFSSYLVDRFLVYLESHTIHPILYITKTDLLDEDGLRELEQYGDDYAALGYPVILSHFPEDSSLEPLLEAIGSHTAVFMGQSGVGKSTLLNQILPELELETGEVSSSLGRGRHTTRHVELIPVGDALIADTPGFSSIELENVEEVAELPFLFPEFVANQDECRFSGCLHQNEPNCRIKEMVAEGTIRQYRYDHYCQFLEEIQNRKPRYNKK